MDKDTKIYVAGHGGMVGSALMRRLAAEGYTNIITRGHKELDLTRQTEVEAFFAEERPQAVFLAAARVGGINANMRYPAEFLTENLLIQSNVLRAAVRYGTERLLFISSCCVYPRQAEQPIPERAVLTGPLEPTNEGYALAKICGQKACEFYSREYGVKYASVMPANLYGYNDCFDPARAHVIPAMIRRFHEAKLCGADKVTIWGRGIARREFLFADDLADACCFLIEHQTGGECLNVGYGQDFTILELAQMIKKVVGFEGSIEPDPTKPEGMMRKFIDSAKIGELGWKPKTNIEEGLRKTYEWFLTNEEVGGVIPEYRLSGALYVFGVLYVWVAAAGREV